MDQPTPKLYTELASWWPLLSAPADYAEEAAFYFQVLLDACPTPPHTLLELGCGGGNNASHLKAQFHLTLVDRSPGMLAVSQALNPECEHLEGDMRSVRLGRLFDAVFIHDAIMYMQDVEELRAALATAFVHCRPGGVALFAPDWVRETFRPGTGHGGHDGATRGLRYLEWTWDPDPTDTTYVVDFAYLLRDENGTRCESERHIEGLFARAEWLRLLAETGFEPRDVPFSHSELPGQCLEVFVGVKPP
jgi:SAM-dependent methyltransferase